MINQPTFSDIIFLVEDKQYYGHKVIISQLSDKFRAMFAGSSNQHKNTIEATHGFSESK